MEKKRRLTFIFFLCVSFLSLRAQLNPQFSQYMEIPTATNPAAVGAEGMMSVFGAYRLQWAGFKGSPRDVFFSLTSPFKVGETKHGAGLIFSSDDIGLFRNQSVLLQYSYKLSLFQKRGELSLGLNLGFVNQKFDKEKVDFTGGDGETMKGDDYHKANDPYLTGFTKEGYSDVTFDASFGVLFSMSGYYIGLSVLHLNSGKIDLGTDQHFFYIPRVYYLTGGCVIETRNPLVQWMPSLQFRTNFSSWQAELTGLLEYNKRIRGGMSYRMGDAFVFIFGVDIISGLHVGYSYDLPTSKLIKSGGSHEVFLRYSFKPQLNRKNKYKSERIL